MIKLQNQLPAVYYNKSRDFQLLGRVYDVVFNYLRTNIKTIYNNPLSENTDEKLFDLISTTLGFESKHDYDIRHLKSMSACFSYILRNKGTKNSIETAINCLLYAQGISETCIVDTDINPYEITVFVPMELRDINLFNDLLDYILPAGINCNVIRQILVSSVDDATTTINSADTYNKIDNYRKVSDMAVVTKVEDFGTESKTNDIKAGLIDDMTLYRDDSK